ncbi:hypothetical protein Tco_1040743 [Tanacetum coccineum]
MSKRQRSTRGQSSSSQEVSIEEKVRRLGVFENSTHQLRYDTLTRRPIHSGDDFNVVEQSKVKSHQDATEVMVEEEDEVDDEGNEATGGRVRWINKMSSGEGSTLGWGQQDDRAHWMYDHTVRQFQYLSTHDNLNPHFQIDPFPGYEADYPPVGYQGYMPTGYEYRPGPSQDDS